MKVTYGFKPRKPRVCSLPVLGSIGSVLSLGARDYRVPPPLTPTPKVPRHFCTRLSTNANRAFSSPGGPLSAELISRSSLQSQQSTSVRVTLDGRGAGMMLERYPNIYRISTRCVGDDCLPRVWRAFLRAGKCGAPHPTLHDVSNRGLTSLEHSPKIVIRCISYRTLYSKLIYNNDLKFL